MNETEILRAKKLGRWLARLRNQAGLSQPSLAKIIGTRNGKKFSASNLATWELGGKVANADILPEMASALGVSLEDLLKVRQTAKGYVPLPDAELPPKRF